MYRSFKSERTRFHITVEIISSGDPWKRPMQHRATLAQRVALSNEYLKIDKLELYDIHKKKKKKSGENKYFAFRLIDLQLHPVHRQLEFHSNERKTWKQMQSHRTARPCSVNRPTRVIAFNRVSWPARRNGQRRRASGKGTFNSARDKYQKNRSGGGGEWEICKGGEPVLYGSAGILKYAIGWLYKGRVSPDT